MKHNKKQDLDSLFDQHLRDALDKLEQVPISPPPSRWDLMEEMLDDEPMPTDDDPYLLSELPDEALDNTVRTALAGNKIPYKPKSWKILEAKILAEEAAELYKKHIRIAEYSILLLALLTFVRFAFFEQDVVKSVIQENMPAVVASVQDFPNTNNTILKPETLTQKTWATNTTNSNVKIFTKQPFVLLSATKGVKNTINSNNNINNNGNNNNNITQKTIAKAAETPKAIVAEKATHNMLAAMEVLPKTTINTIKNELPTTQVHVVASNPIASASVPTAVEGKTESDMVCAITHTTIQNVPAAGTLRLGMVLHSDANYIKTPSVDKLFDRAFASLSAGYGIGFTIGYQVKKLEIESGMIYAFKHNEFQSDKTITGNFQTGYVIEQLRGVEWNTVKLPLNLRYQVAKQNSWTTYAKVGSALDLVLISNYNKQFQGASNARTVSTLPETKGLLHGGRLDENYYMTANIGMGFEKRLSPSTVLVIEPTYHHQISNNGLGIIRDKIYTLSFNTGLKVNLSK
jgi:hypothetical protein